ncbi:hypothetical protein J5754_01690 [bacterium]|nr:hypothetical protein [bacterium]
MKKLIFILSCVLLLTGTLRAETEYGVSAVCEAWSSAVTLDTENVPNTSSNPIELHFWDELQYSTRWADCGYNKGVVVKANAEGVAEQDVFSTDVDGLEGIFNWNYSYTDSSVLPRGNSKVYAVTHVITDTTNGVSYAVDSETVYVTLSEDTSVETNWSDDFKLDNVSVSKDTLELDSPASITYSTDWIEGYDRSVKIQLVEKESSGPSIFSVPSEPYTVFTSEGEEKGDYSWDYSGVDPTVLPRNTSYLLTYTVYSDDGTVFGTETATAAINLLPEPGFMLIFALALIVLKGGRSL